jgi:hypothetical protein
MWLKMYYLFMLSTAILVYERFGGRTGRGTTPLDTSSLAGYLGEVRRYPRIECIVVGWGRIHGRR